MRRHPLAKRPKDARQGFAVGFVARKGGFCRDRAGRRMGNDGAIVGSLGETGEPRAHPPIARRELPLADLRELTDEGDAVGGEPALQRRSDAPQQRHRLVGEKSRRIVPAQHREAARLVEVGGDLGEKLAVAQTDREGDAEPGLDPPRQRGEELRRRRAVQSGGPREVEKCLVDRDRLNERGQPPHLGAHRPPDFAVLRHIRPDHHCIRAGGQRLEHRHCGADAIKPRHVAAGEHDPARTAADDQRAGGQLRLLALFDRRVERVTVDMGDRQSFERRVADQSRRSTARAAPAPRGWPGQLGELAAVAAQRAHPTVSSGHSQAAPRTPLAAPWAGVSSRVETRSENTYRAHPRGTSS